MLVPCWHAALTKLCEYLAGNKLWHMLCYAYADKVLACEIISKAPTSVTATRDKVLYCAVLTRAWHDEVLYCAVLYNRRGPGMTRSCMFEPAMPCDVVLA